MSKELDHESIDAALSNHAVDRKYPFGRSARLIALLLVILVGLGCFLIAFFAGKQSSDDASNQNITIDTPTPSPEVTVPTPAPLAPDIQAAIATWPYTTPFQIPFGDNSSNPADTVASDVIYKTVAAFLKDHPNINATITAYTLPNDTGRKLSQLRLEYVLSQLQEKGIQDNRISASVQDVQAMPTATTAQTVYIGRTVFDGESVD